MANEKLKIAFYWAASCGGCEIAVLDINEKILDVIQLADIVFWPVAMDVKYKDVENMPDKYIDICFFNGSVRNEEQEYMAKLLRQKAKTLIAFGSCAQEGCIPGLANLHNREEIFEKVYLKSHCVENPVGTVPQTRFEAKEGLLKLPEFYDTVKTLDQTVEVDYYIPGCPPPVSLITSALEAVAKNQLPPKGTVLAPPKSVCDECPRKKENKKITKIYRVHKKMPEPEKCLLEQGIICMGPATRSGCGAQCLNVDMPCTGCGGPCPNSPEQGAAMVSALASILGLEEEKDRYTEKDIEELMRQIKDPVGTFYMYSLPSSILRRKVMKK
ncbi:MAG: oxidoreductase [Candidatus Bathyarchaeia archaeon]|jgi:F420-non-reducing hydrogenase small subunit|nr:oxidoreductase [Candidatus Bathyarchaeota archaeon A05DMB-4]MDH7595976.1 oxidoreductase [Candidatus Bathyarchaeota archaeon]